MADNNLKEIMRIAALKVQEIVDQTAPNASVSMADEMQLYVDKYQLATLKALSYYAEARSDISQKEIKTLYGEEFGVDKFEETSCEDYDDAVAWLVDCYRKKLN